jgi:dihydroorotate dehydrogenase electron transfer subunit
VTTAETTSKSHRGTIFVEDAEILEQLTHPADQFVLRVRAPRISEVAMPGSFAHITCAPGLPMRRPLSIMRADRDEGTLDFLYKIVGEGLGRLSQRRPGDSVSVLGPIGQPFRPDPERPRSLLIGGGVGIPPMVFLAEHMAAGTDSGWQPLVLMGSEVPFPFRLTRVGEHRGLPGAASAAIEDLQAKDIVSRLASMADLDGCYRGYVTDLAAEWLSGLADKEIDEVTMFACGPTPMLEAAAAVARRFGVPCQVSLEEYMACAVGGCAGCAVAVRTDDGVAMKRVCVDGPVFDAEAVFPPAA